MGFGEPLARGNKDGSEAWCPGGLQGEAEVFEAEPHGADDAVLLDEYDLIDDFRHRMRQHPVQQYCYVTGTVDFVLVVVARDLEEFERFTREALMDHPNVRSFTTFVAMDRIKSGSARPLDEG